MRHSALLLGLLSLSLPVAAQLPGMPTGESEELVMHALENQVKVSTTHAETSVYGSGVWLGEGWILTANHLFNGYHDGDPIQVSIRGQTLDAKMTARGDLEDSDLALLRVIGNPQVTWKGPRICSKPTAVSAPLGVVSYDNVIKTFATPERAIYSKGEVWSEATIASMSPGVSGSPVFDESQACMAGIISRVDERFMLFGTNVEQQKECIAAARGQTHKFFPITCGTSAPTVFSSLESLKDFLKQSGVHAQGL